MKRAAVLTLSMFCVTASLSLGACKSNKAEPEETAAAEAGADEAATETGATETGTTETGAAETGAAETGVAETGVAETGGAEVGASDDAGADDAGETAEADPVKPLLDEVTNKKTKDDRAMAALAEAKKAGAEARQLAEAANKRGTNLMTSPDRATKFFEYARTADDKYPDASFNLAKLAANTGEVATVKELLQETKDRGGKKLLKTVGFDPTFALVADDPDVVALTK